MNYNMLLCDESMLCRPTPLFALYFILSRDVPILKSFSDGRPKIFACCSGGYSVVAAVAELSWPNVGCKNGRRKQRIAYQTFSFSNFKGKTKTIKKVTTPPSIQSVQRSHNDFLRPMKHDLAASDEVATWKVWELARICFHSSLYDTLGQTEP